MSTDYRTKRISYYTNLPRATWATLEAYEALRTTVKYHIEILANLDDDKDFDEYDRMLNVLVHINRHIMALLKHLMPPKKGGE